MLGLRTLWCQLSEIISLRTNVNIYGIELVNCCDDKFTLSWYCTQWRISLKGNNLNSRESNIIQGLPIFKSDCSEWQVPSGGEVSTLLACVGKSKMGKIADRVSGPNSNDSSVKLRRYNQNWSWRRHCSSITFLGLLVLMKLCCLLAEKGSLLSTPSTPSDCTKLILCYNWHIFSTRFTRETFFWKSLYNYF